MYACGSDDSTSRSAAAAGGDDDTFAWTQLGPGGQAIARYVHVSDAADFNCPTLDIVPSGSIQMSMRSQPRDTDRMGADQNGKVYFDDYV